MSSPVSESASAAISALSRFVPQAVLDPARPQVLSYITVEGRPVLAGVAYAVPTHGARDAPSEPAGREAWHFHAGTVAEESFLPDHHHAGEGPGSDTRVAVLHVWVWQQNPVGMFEPDNWSLPFARLGFNQPDSAADAGRALSLATVGAPFFLAMVREVAHPDSGSLRRVAESLAAHAATVSAWAADRRGRVLDASDSAWLAREWAALWRELRSLAPSDAWSRLQ